MLLLAPLCAAAAALTVSYDAASASLVAQPANATTNATVAWSADAPPLNVTGPAFALPVADDAVYANLSVVLRAPNGDVLEAAFVPALAVPDTPIAVVAVAASPTVPRVPGAAENVTWAANATDAAGSFDTLTFVWEFGGDTSASGVFEYPADQARVVTLTVVDEDGGSVQTTAQRATPPFVQAPDGVLVVDEGAAPGLLVVDPDDRGIDFAAVAIGGALRDDGASPVNVTVAIVPGVDGAQNATVSVRAANVAPRPTSDPVQGVAQGAALPTPSATDAAGSFDTLTFVWSMEPLYAVSMSGTNLTLTVVDEDGGTSTQVSPGVTVSNVAPTVVSALGSVSPGAVGESVAVSFAVSATDPGLSWDTLTFVWSLGEDGGPVTVFDDGADLTLSVVVSDGNGGSTTVASEALARATNAAPVIVSVDGVPASLAQGATVPDLDATVAVVATDAGFSWDTLTFSWLVADTAPASARAATEAELVVTDEDGGQSTTTATIATTNVAPTITGATVSLGATAFVAAATDPGGSWDTLTFQWTFGDGSFDVVASDQYGEGTPLSGTFVVATESASRSMSQSAPLTQSESHSADPTQSAVPPVSSGSSALPASDDGVAGGTVALVVTLVGGGVAAGLGALATSGSGSLLPSPVAVQMGGFPLLDKVQTAMVLGSLGAPAPDVLPDFSSVVGIFAFVLPPAFDTGYQQRRLLSVEAFAGAFDLLPRDVFPVTLFWTVLVLVVYALLALALGRALPAHAHAVKMFGVVVLGGMVAHFGLTFTAALHLGTGSDNGVSIFFAVVAALYLAVAGIGGLVWLRSRTSTFVFLFAAKRTAFAFFFGICHDEAGAQIALSVLVVAAFLGALFVVDLPVRGRALHALAGVVDLVSLLVLIDYVEGSGVPSDEAALVVMALQIVALVVLAVAALAFAVESRRAGGLQPVSKREMDAVSAGQGGQDVEVVGLEGILVGGEVKAAGSRQRVAMMEPTDVADWFLTLRLPIAASEKVLRDEIGGRSLIKASPERLAEVFGHDAGQVLAQAIDDLPDEDYAPSVSSGQTPRRGTVSRSSREVAQMGPKEVADWLSNAGVSRATTRIVVDNELTGEQMLAATEVRLLRAFAPEGALVVALLEESKAASGPVSPSLGEVGGPSPHSQHLGHRRRQKIVALSDFEDWTQYQVAEFASKDLQISGCSNAVKKHMVTGGKALSLGLEELMDIFGRRGGLQMKEALEAIRSGRPVELGDDSTRSQSPFRRLPKRLQERIDEARKKKAPARRGKKGGLGPHFSANQVSEWMLAIGVSTASRELVETKGVSGQRVLDASLEDLIETFGDKDGQKIWKALPPPEGEESDGEDEHDVATRRAVYKTTSTVSIRSEHGDERTEVRVVDDNVTLAQVSEMDCRELVAWLRTKGVGLDRCARIQQDGMTGNDLLTASPFVVDRICGSGAAMELREILEGIPKR